MHITMSEITANYLINKAIASATLSPSSAAEMIPPAKPAPSPVGYNPATSGCCNDSLSRGIRTGVDVRDSTPTTTASLVK